jgi:PhnB protein
MSKNANMPKGLVPHLVVNDCAAAMDFYAKAFGAEELFRIPAPDGKRIVHAEMTISGQPFYLCDDFPEYCEGAARSAKALGGSPVTIHKYVDDVDAVVARAEKAGATVKMPPTDMFWGDRYGGVEDPFGHSWSFATHIKDVTPEEIEAGMKASFGG